MELKDFISKTLIDIKTGLRDANEHFAKEQGKQLGIDADAPFLLQSCYHDKKSGYIDFDVAVTISKEGVAEGGGGIKIAIVDIGGNVKNSDRLESISRIKFQIGSSLTIG